MPIRPNFWVDLSANHSQRVKATCMLIFVMKLPSTNCRESIPKVRMAHVVESKELSSALYAGELLAELYRLYQDKVMCDIILYAGGFQVMAHRAILMAASPYFKDLLQRDNTSSDGMVHLESKS